MMKKQMQILQKTNKKFQELLQKQVNFKINQENQITPFNKLGQFKIEGWLDCQHTNTKTYLNQCELNIKSNEQDKIYLFSLNREIGRFQYKGEKTLYYLLYEKFLEIHVEVNEDIQKCSSNKEFNVVQIQVEINLFVNPFLFNQDNTISEQSKIKFILAILELQELMKASFLFYLYPIEKKIQLQGPCYSQNIILKWMIEREKNLSSISDQKFRGGVFVEIEQGYIFDRFYDLINHKARLQARKSQTLIITFGESIVEQKQLDIRRKYPNLSSLCINEGTIINNFLQFDFVIISIDYVKRQYDQFKLQHLNTIFSFQWKRIIVDLSIIESQLIYNLYFINLLNTKYKWIYLQKFDEQVKRTSLNFILDFFNLERKAFEKYFAIENKPQQVKRRLSNIATQQQQIPLSQISIKSQIILVDLNYEELQQYNEIRYQRLENDIIEVYAQKFNSLRQLCSLVQQNKEQKYCSICFIPLQDYYEYQMCSHNFCHQCLQHACLLCDKIINENQFKKCKLQNTFYNQQSVENKQIKLIQLIQNLKGKIVIITQYPNKLEQLINNSTLSLYNVQNLSSELEFDRITQSINEFDEDNKQTILILNPIIIREKLIIIKSAHYLIFYDQIWDFNQEESIIQKLYNVRAIFKLIVKGTVEEQIVFLQHLQSNKTGREGVLENQNLIKTILQYQQQ
ncbi:unnamed protein product [Paramecium pentaurelia]|uniref:RING-type domain-containing protein n=1 Tax=Paramecium pentaurelia TaxID=43138 RepID=A0A8S1Y199_9CILI|nr:unnamed protein product [Paramecium pentaurelia]